MLILVAVMVVFTILFFALLRVGKEGENLLEERRRNRSESKNNK